MHYISRKNKVFLVHNLIEKHFNDEKTFHQEIENLHFLRQKNIPVPHIISVQYPIVFLEYIEGDTLCDSLDRICMEEIDSLYQWLRKYHQATQALRGDINLRNFIMTPHHILYGVDFEEPFEKGDFEKDYGRLLAFIATYTPQFTDQKRKGAMRLLENIDKNSGDLEKVETFYFEEIDAMKGRRKTTADFGEKAQAFFTSIKKGGYR